MSTTAELFGKFAHRYDTHGLSVFFTEQSHSTGLFRLIYCHDIGAHR